jgi:hypothetical protein
VRRFAPRTGLQRSANEMTMFGNVTGDATASHGVSRNPRWAEVNAVRICRRRSLI